MLTCTIVANGRGAPPVTPNSAGLLSILVSPYVRAHTRLSAHRILPCTDPEMINAELLGYGVAPAPKGTTPIFPVLSLLTGQLST